MTKSNDQMTDDIALIKEYLAGGDAAAEELVRRHQRQIYALAYRMTQDMEEAKDLTQKTFVKAFQGLAGFRMESSFRTWLYQIAANAGLSHVGRRRETVDLDEVNAGVEPAGLTALIEEEKRLHIQEGLRKLPDRQRLAVMLRVYDGLSCSETAGVMGCSEGAVKAHYHLGVKKLRDHFKEKGYDITA